MFLYLRSFPASRPFAAVALRRVVTTKGMQCSGMVKQERAQRPYLAAKP